MADYFMGKVVDGMYHMGKSVSAIFQYGNQLWAKIATQYLKYLGTSFTATNTLSGTTKGLQIRGKTIQDENGIESVNGNVSVMSLSRNLVSMTKGFGLTSATLEDGIYTVYATGSRQDNVLSENINYYKNHIGEKFTIFVNVLENTMDSTFSCILNTSYMNAFAGVLNATVGFTGILKTTRTVQSQTSYSRVLVITSYATEGYIKLQYIIMKGDQTHLDVTQENWDYYAQYGEDTITIENVNLMSSPNGDVYDLVDVTNKRIETNIGSRDYVDGDLALDNVWVDDDLTTTYYVLDTPIYTDIEVQQLDTYDLSTEIYQSGSNVQANIYAEIPTDDVGLQEYEDAVDALEQLGVTPSEYHNENMDALEELGVSV